ncbi:MAG: RHS repeat-associated core domain-containing protein [Francisellaceae bacterium]
MKRILAYCCMLASSGILTSTPGFAVVSSKVKASATLSPSMSDDMQSTALTTNNPGESAVSVPQTPQQNASPASLLTGVSVSPSGSLSYSQTLWLVNANYGYTSFPLSVSINQSAPASYVGGFSGDDHSHQHPFGISAYLPNFPGYINNASGNGTSVDPDTYYYLDPTENAGATASFDLPALYLNTARPSKYYGYDKDLYDGGYHTASLSFGDQSFNFYFKVDDSLFNGDPHQITNSDYTLYAMMKGFVDSAYAVYSKDGQKIQLSLIKDKQTHEYYIKAVTPDGTSYYFQFQKYLGGNGINYYNPDAKEDGNDNTELPGVFVFSIARIVYNTGRYLQFDYDFDGLDALSQISIKDDKDRVLAKIQQEDMNSSTPHATVYGLINQTLTPVYQLDYAHTTSGNFILQLPRISKITYLPDPSIQTSFSYTDDEHDYSDGGNSTLLTGVSDAKSGVSATISYTRLGQEMHTASLNTAYNGYNYVVSQVDYQRQGDLLARQRYNYMKDPNNNYGDNVNYPYQVPKYSGDYSYPIGSGFDAWYDTLFWGQNQDDVDTAQYNLTNSTYIVAISNSLYHSTDSSKPYLTTKSQSTYDALRRLIHVQNWVNGNYVSQTGYTYNPGMAEIGSAPDEKTYPSFDSLPESYNKPIQVKSDTYKSTVNGYIVNSNPTPLTSTSNSVYDTAGNTTETTAYVNGSQVAHSTISYLPAASTYPLHYELLTQSTKTYSNTDDQYVETRKDYGQFSNPIDSNALFPAVASISVSTSASAYQPTAASQSQPILNYQNQFSYTQSADVNQNGMENLTKTTFPATAQSKLTTFSNVPMLSIDTDEGTFSGSISAQNEDETLSDKSGKTVVDFTGQVIKTINKLGQETDYHYDDQGRISTTTYLAGTADAYTITDKYNQAANLALNADALYSHTVIDGYGNQSITLYNWRSQAIASYQQDVGQSAPILISSNSYNDLGQLIKTTSYVKGGDSATTTPSTSTQYYYNQFGSMVAVVPETGLAQGTIVDQQNGNTLSFSYEPASDQPTVIAKIIGNVSLQQMNKTTSTLTLQATIKNSLANAVLDGMDLTIWPSTATEQVIQPAADSNNPLFQGISDGRQILQTKSAVALLAKLYDKAVFGDSPYTNSGLISLTTYQYDSWQRAVNITEQFVHNDTDDATNNKRVSLVTKLSYSSDGKHLIVMQPNDNVITTDYNHLGQLISKKLSIIDSNNQAKSTTLQDNSYNVLGYLVNSTTLSHGKSSYLYDDNWRLTSTTNALGVSTSIQYDPITSAIDSIATGSNKTQYQYDKYGNVIHIQDQAGNSLSSSYDNSGQLISSSETHADNGKTFTWKYSYNPYGVITQIYNPFLLQFSSDGASVSLGNTIALNYDQYGRLISQTNGVNEDSYSGKIEYRYNNYNQLTQKRMTAYVSDLTTMDFSYNDLGQMTQQYTSETGDSYSQDRSLIDYTYNDLGQLQQKSTVVGHKLNEITPNLPVVNDYYYDQYGRLTSMYQSAPEAKTPTDTIGWVNDYLGDGIQSQRYSYDVYNNLVEETTATLNSSNAVSKRYQYSSTNPFQLSTIETQRGQPATTTTASLSYDAMGRVIQNYDGNQISYNDLGQVATITTANGITESFGYGPLGHMLSENSSKTGVTSENYYMGNTLAARGYNIGTANEVITAVTPYGQATYKAANADKRDTSACYDQLNIKANNNIIVGACPGSSSSITRLNSYTPYGVLTNITQQTQTGYPDNLNTPDLNEDKNLNTVLGYQSAMTDNVTGYQFLGNGTRLYDPVISHFLQADPIGVGYDYASGNPIAFNDPSGMSSENIDRNYGHRAPMPSYDSSTCDDSPAYLLWACGGNYIDGNPQIAHGPPGNPSSGKGGWEAIVLDTAIDIPAYAFGGGPLVGVLLGGLVNHYILGIDNKNSYKYAAENDPLFGEGVTAGVDYSEGQYIEGFNATIAEIELLGALAIDANLFWTDEDFKLQEATTNEITDYLENSSKSKLDEPEGWANYKRLADRKAYRNSKWYRNYSFPDHIRAFFKESLYYGYVTNRFSPYLDYDSWSDYFQRLAVLYAINLATSGLEGVSFVESNPIERVVQKLYDYPLYNLPVLVYGSSSQYATTVINGITQSYFQSLGRWGFSKFSSLNGPGSVFGIKLNQMLIYFQSPPSQDIPMQTKYFYSMTGR